MLLQCKSIFTSYRQKQYSKFNICNFDFAIYYFYSSFTRHTGCFQKNTQLWPGDRVYLHYTSIIKSHKVIIGMFACWVFSYWWYYSKKKKFRAIKNRKNSSFLWGFSFWALELSIMPSAVSISSIMLYPSDAFPLFPLTFCQWAHLLGTLMCSKSLCSSEKKEKVTKYHISTLFHMNKSKICIGLEHKKHLTSEIWH